MINWVVSPSGKFQSAPPVETRGDDRTMTTTTTEEKFQSAPPVETRGDKVFRLLA